MKRRMRFLTSIVISVIAIALLTCGCGKKEATVTEVDLSSVGNVVPELNPGEMPTPKNQNLLTGIFDLSKEAIGKRPVAVMVNNVKAALPQYGITQADVIFELPVEGDLTRLMALYGDYTTMPDICAIRSCRYYYPAIAKGFDAFYVHWGSDQTILSYLKSIQPDKFDGLSNDGGLFGRDKDRRNSGYSLEHTGVFKGTQFASVVSKNGNRVELKNDKKEAAFNFAEYGKKITPNDGACNKVSIRFGACNSKLEYNSESGTYFKSMNGHTHIDGRTGEQLSFTNVFVLETSISIRDSEGHKSINWQGSGSSKGYYISNGAVQTIRWSQPSESSYLRFYDESGNELEINRGKSYIAYTYNGRTTIE